MKPRFRKLLSILLIAAMVFNIGITSVLAKGTSLNASKLTACHPAHDKKCGYDETKVETSCNHSCEKCKTLDSEDTAESKNVCSCSPVDGSELVHDKNCSLYIAPKLSDEIKDLIAMVDALPNLKDITNKNKETTRTNFETATKAYELLTKENKAVFEATEQYKKLMALHTVLSPAAPMANSPVTLNIGAADKYVVISATGYTVGNAATETPYTGDYIITGSTTSTNATATRNHITVSGGTHNITLKDASIITSLTSRRCAFAVEGNSTVNLTLEGTNKLVSEPERAALEVESGNTLVITNASTGSLTATGGDNGAGIGSGTFSKSGNITINGGTVNATGGSSGAGIGGGRSSGGGNITILGGTITANTSKGGAGIGGGSYKAGGKIIIKGGDITATAGPSNDALSDGAGIGGGKGGAGGEITISGGSIKSTGGYFGAGIGGGNNASGGKIAISGGVITAEGNGNSAGIGGGDNGGAGGDITISGGKVTARGNNLHGVGIGGGNRGAGGKITINNNALVYTTKGTRSSNYIGAGNGGTSAVVTKTNSIVFEGTNGTVYGTFTVKENLSINAQSILLVPVDAQLIIPPGIILSNYGKIINRGTITGTVSENQPIVPAAPVTLDIKEPSAYVEITATGYKVGGGTETPHTGDYIITGTTTSTNAPSVNSFSSHVKVSGGTPNITLKDTDIQFWGGGKRAFLVDGSSTVNLTLEGTNVLSSAPSTSALEVKPGSALNITEASTGNLTATGGDNGAGIGGGGNISIYGGTITAIGGWNSAGIGGDGHSNPPSFPSGGGNITISGGKVTAKGGDNGAGIGDGNKGSGCNITINDNALVFATKGKNATDHIGAGNGGTPATVDKIDCIIFEGTIGTVYGKATLKHNLTIEDSQTLFVETGTELIIPNDITLTNNGRILNRSTITGNVTNIQPIVPGAPVTLDISEPDKNVEITTSGYKVGGAQEITHIGGYIITGTRTSTIVNYPIMVSSGIHNITLKDANISLSSDSRCAFLVKGNSTVNLTLQGTNVLSSDYTSPGLNVSTGNTLIITEASTGSLTAASNGGAGIGGDYNGSGGNITILGGTITANAKGDGAGIGGGYGGSGGNITILGGTVKANGSNTGAGIGGGGYGGSGGNITILGGTVTAKSGNTGAGIGGGDGVSNGYGGPGGNITIGDNALVYATKGSSAPNHIGAGLNGNGGTVNKNGGIIFEGDTGEVYGYTLEKNFNLTSSQSLEIMTRQTLTVPRGISLTNSGTITNIGTITNNGTVINNGTLSNSGILSGTGTTSGSGPLKMKLTDNMITLPKSSYAYTGNPITPTVTVSTTFWNKTINYPQDPHFKVEYKDNTGVGTATVTIAPQGSDLLGDPVVKRFSIIKSDSTLELTTNKSSYTYGESINFTASVSIPASMGRSAAINTVDFYCGTTKLNESPITLNESGGSGSATYTYKTADKKIPAGTQTITAHYGGSSSLNGQTSTISITLNKKELTGTVKAGQNKLYDGTSTFTGVEVIPTASNVISGDSPTITANGSAEDANAGANKTFTITNANIGGTLEGFYSLPTNLSTITGNVEIKKANASGINQTFLFTENTAKNDYKFDLSKLLPSVTPPATLGTVTYSTTATTGNVLSANPTIADGEITLPVKAVSTNTTQDITISITSDNYTIANVTLTLKAVDKKPLNITANMTDRDYNGQPLSYMGTPIFTKSDSQTVTNVTYKVEYEGTGSTTYEKNETAPTNAGTYKAIFTVSGDSANTYVGSVDVMFTINKATITIKANDKSAYVGNPAPTLGVSDYTVGGLVNNETLKTPPNIYYETVPDMTKEGNVEITVSGAVAPDGGNYKDIVYKSATLTIMAQNTIMIEPINPPDPNTDIDITNDFKVGFKGEYGNLASIKLNGIELTRTVTSATTCDLSGWPDYNGTLGKLESGSVYITLSKAFLQTLPNGKYILDLTLSSGTTTELGSVQFTVNQSATPPTTTPDTKPENIPESNPEETIPPTESTPNVSVPQTGDNSNMGLWIVLMLLTIGGVSVFTWKLREKKKKLQE